MDIEQVHVGPCTVKGSVVTYCPPVVDFDFNNAAGFTGVPATNLDGQFVVYYFSHAMLFCAGALIEAHMVLTPAVCVFGEDYMFQVFGGSHNFREGYGTSRQVESICFHRAYNHSRRWDQCMNDNIALLVLQEQFVMRYHEPKSEFILNRVRYGLSLETIMEKNHDPKCRYFGWGSRRNGFLLPLLLHMRRVDVKIYLDNRKCEELWNTDNKYLCLSRPDCINDKYGALCPDDLGSVVVCGGYVQGMMTSELIDRPCGVGFLNLALYTKFLECAVDDSRDAMEEIPPEPPLAMDLVTVPSAETTTPCQDCGPEVTLATPTKMDKNAQAESILSTDTTKLPERIGRYLNKLHYPKKHRIRGVHV